MQLKKILPYIAITVLFGIGVFIGRYIHSYQDKCMVIHSRRDMFYGKLSQHLKTQMEDLGYNFNCPNFFSKVVIDFVYTGKDYAQNRYEKRPKDITVALIGDCFISYDIDFLKEYDYLLVLVEDRFGYLAMFNFKALHLPIDKKQKTMCNTHYEEQTVDIKDLSMRLDDIIKRALNETK